MKGAPRHPVLMGNCPNCCYMPWSYLSTKWFAINPLHVVRGTWDSVATNNMPLEKKVGMKCIRVNVLNNKARVTRRLYVFIMSHTHFRVNLHSVVTWMWRNSLIETGAISGVKVAATGFEPTTTQPTFWPKCWVFSTNGWVFSTNWLSVLYELQVFMD